MRLFTKCQKLERARSDSYGLNLISSIFTMESPCKTCNRMAPVCGICDLPLCIFSESCMVTSNCTHAIRTKVIRTDLFSHIYSVNLSGSAISDVRPLYHMKYLDLSECPNIMDVSSLGHIHELHLSSTKITNVSSLGGVHTLNLSYCQGITDIRTLSGVYDLNLAACRGITDVGTLGKVHKLNLSSCMNIESVAGLHTVHILYLTRMKFQTGILTRGTKHVETLTENHTLDLSFTNIVDVRPFRHIQCLYLIGCEQLRDVSSLGEVFLLDLFYSRGIQPTRAISKVPHLRLPNGSER